MTSHRFRRLAARAALVGCLAVGVIACGDDDDADTGADAEADTGGTDDQAAGGDACDAIVEFNAAATQVDTEAASEDELAGVGEELGSLWADIEAGAPDEVSDEVASITEALDDLAAGDPAKFDADETFESYTTVLGATVDACEFEALSVTGVDYAFEGLPETVPAGTVAMHFKNDSESEMHEMIIFKKPEGDTRSAEELLNDPAMEESGPPPSGFAFAPPGGMTTGLAELDAGSYFAVCFIPVGSGDLTEEQAAAGEGGPPHFTQGMLAEFTVE